MSVSVYSVFVLSCVGSCLATGRSLIQGVLSTVFEVQISELINSEWAEAREPNPSTEKKKNLMKFLSIHN
jgi:hypothetical protein